MEAEVEVVVLSSAAEEERAKERLLRKGDGEEWKPWMQQEAEERGSG